MSKTRIAGRTPMADKYKVTRTTEGAFPLGLGPTIHKVTVTNTETGKSASTYGKDQDAALQEAKDKLRANE